MNQKDVSIFESIIPNRDQFTHSNLHLMDIIKASHLKFKEKQNLKFGIYNTYKKKNYFQNFILCSTVLKDIFNAENEYYLIAMRFI